MGNKLFGVNISGIIKKNIGPGVLAATLTRVGKTQDQEAGSLTGPPTSADPDIYPCRAFTESFSLRDIGTEVSGVKIKADDRRITIIGDTLPSGIVPQASDTIFIESQTFKVLGMLNRDPAAATYQIHARA